MRNAWISKAGMVTLVGVMVLSAGVGLRSQDVSAAQVDVVSQAWDKNISNASRFTVLAAFGGAAVRDNQTGLVWEQAPDITGGPYSNGTRNWFESISHCVNKTIGGTVGWRLPSVVELMSVQDRSPGAIAPFVPASVFSGVQSDYYWSATTVAVDPSVSWMVFFGGSNVGGSNRSTPLHPWCVRGAMNADAY